MRRLLVKIHLWLGLTLGLLWAIQGITGSLLVFHREIDQWTHSELNDGPMESLVDLVASAEQAANAPIERITVIGTNHRILEARYTDDLGRPKAVRLDASSGRVLGLRDRAPVSPFSESGWRWVYILHNRLLAGDVGIYAIGVSGLFLAVSLSIGIYIGWPRRRTWTIAFSPSKWRNSLQMYFGWHRALGLVTSIVFFVIVITGTYMAFDSTIAPVLARITSFQTTAVMGHSKSKAAHTGTRVKVSADDALAIAKAVFPEGDFMNIEMPIEHPNYYSIRFTLPDELRRWAGRATVQVDAWTGQVLEVYDPQTVTLINKVDDAAFPIHTGEFAGLPGRVVVAFSGVLLPVLFVTGTGLWYLRRVRKRGGNRGREV